MTLPWVQCRVGGAAADVANADRSEFRPSLHCRLRRAYLYPTPRGSGAIITIYF